MERSSNRKGKGEADEKEEEEKEGEAEERNKEKEEERVVGNWIINCSREMRVPFRKLYCL